MWQACANYSPDQLERLGISPSDKIHQSCTGWQQFPTVSSKEDGVSPWWKEGREVMCPPFTKLSGCPTYLPHPQLVYLGSKPVKTARYSPKEDPHCMGSCGCPSSRSGKMASQAAVSHWYPVNCCVLAQSLLLLVFLLSADFSLRTFLHPSPRNVDILVFW